MEAKNESYHKKTFHMSVLLKRGFKKHDLTEIVNDGTADKYLQLKSATTLEGKIAKFSPKMKSLAEKYKSFYKLPYVEFVNFLSSNGEKKIIKECILNKYGAGPFCRFAIKDKSIFHKTGLYCFCVDETIMYIGRCQKGPKGKNNIKKRVNDGYGKINPKNCYKDGQATNCHVNNLIYTAFFVEKKEIEFLFLPIDGDEIIAAKEEDFIAQYNPKWNILLKEE